MKCVLTRNAQKSRQFHKEFIFLQLSKTTNPLGGLLNKLKKFKSNIQGERERHFSACELGEKTCKFTKSVCVCVCVCVCVRERERQIERDRERERERERCLTPKQENQSEKAKWRHTLKIKYRVRKQLRKAAT